MKRRLFALLAAAALLFAVALTKAGASGDGRPLHEVRGQGVVQLSPPDGAVYVVSINAWQDETGVYGIATWLNEFPLGGNPEYSGWQWVIDVDTLIMLSDNEVRVEGVIVQDNKFPEWTEGDRISIGRVKDNGQGAADPPDEIFGVPIYGGNFIVR